MSMLKSDLHPPEAGPGSDPVLYGVAAGLTELFPPVGLALRPSEEGAEAEAPEADARD